MKTEQELKAMVTPDIIKKMCELAEGFKDYPKTVSLDTSAHLKNDIVNWCMFPLLIHRAVEGWNLKCESWEEIRIDYESKNVSISGSNKKLIKNYQPENLTALECACLHCLLEIFEEKI